MNWLVYNELAWVDSVLSPPQNVAQECIHLGRMLKAHAHSECQTLLHLGCGAGVYDFTFKKHIEVTGIDVSIGMLAEAQRRNPEINYICADMRSVRLRKSYDAVIIPDAIDYMITADDLRRAMLTAWIHLKMDGIVLVKANMAEEFQNNNFVYSGESQGITVTLFENNHISASRPDTYEATFCYLIRRQGELEIRHELHTLGLFKRSVWCSVFKEIGFERLAEVSELAYQENIQSKGTYPVKVFIAAKNHSS
jgi:hypothetical protein